jgi:ribosomal protein S18 acetylase RimI-like enzyme
MLGQQAKPAAKVTSEQGKDSMDNDLHIALEERPGPGVEDAISRGLHDFDRRQAGDSHLQRLCFSLRGPGQEIVGGVLGQVFWDGLFIETLWVADELRGRGYGHELLMSIEDEGRRRGARMVYLDTFSFQAPDFYRRHGYRQFGELDGFPPGHRLLFFTKRL